MNNYKLQIKITSYVDTGDSFRLVTNFLGPLINGKHYCLKLVENLPIMTTIEPVFIQLGGPDGTTLIPLIDCLGNNLMDDSLKGCEGSFEMRFGSNPPHFQVISKIRRSAYYALNENIGAIFTSPSVTPVTSITSATLRSTSKVE